MYSKKAVWACILAGLPIAIWIIALLLMGLNIEFGNILLYVSIFPISLLSLLGLIIAIFAWLGIKKESELQGKGLVITSFVLVIVEVISVLIAYNVIKSAWAS